MTKRRVARLALLIDQHRMALRKRAALRILTRQANPVTVEQQRAEGERLTGRPVNPFAALDCLAAIVEEALNRAVYVEALRHRGELAADLLQRRDRHAGVAAARIVDVVGELELLPLPVEPVGLVGLVASPAFVLSVEPRTPVGLH